MTNKSPTTTGPTCKSIRCTKTTNPDGKTCNGYLWYPEYNFSGKDPRRCSNVFCIKPRLLERISDDEDEKPNV